MPDADKIDMKERILQTADRLFYLQGIRAIGVDTIAAEIGISKRTLYNHFPSKDALISAYLMRRFVKPRPSDKSPVDQILGTFDSLERRFSAKDFRGCPFVNAVAELGPQDKAVKKIAVAFKESRRLWFRDLLKELGAADAEGLATQLTLLVDGAIAQDLVRDDPAMARAAKQAARVLLANAGNQRRFIELAARFGCGCYRLIWRFSRRCSRFFLRSVRATRYRSIHHVAAYVAALLLLPRRLAPAAPIKKREKP